MDGLFHQQVHQLFSISFFPSDIPSKSGKAPGQDLVVLQDMMAQGALHMVMEHPTVPGAAVPEKKKKNPFHFHLAGSWALRMKSCHWASGSLLNDLLATGVAKGFDSKHLILQLPRGKERKFSHAEQFSEVNRENPVA